MFSSSMTCAVGGIDSVGSSASFAYCSRMWFSWPSRRTSSSSVSASRARRATCSTSVRDRLGIAAMISDALPPTRAGELSAPLTNASARADHLPDRRPQPDLGGALDDRSIERDDVVADGFDRLDAIPHQE